KPDLSPTSWKVCTHPEGAPYFSDIQNLGAVEKCISRLSELTASHSITFPSPPSSLSFELVLELANGKSRKQCQYYFVDTERRLLFWVHGLVPGKMYANLRGIKKQGHIKMALEMRYWTHCELYPHERMFDAAVYRELYGLVIHANAKSITSDTSLAPFESTELSKMMDIVRVLQDLFSYSAGQVNDPIMCAVVRFRCIFCATVFCLQHSHTLPLAINASTISRRYTHSSNPLFELPRPTLCPRRMWKRWQKYVNEITDTVIGADHMAIMFSVPFGLLIWGCVFTYLYLSTSISFLALFLVGDSD
ncbi:hypothetical protein F5J12DRAFT_833877, partial [Pisolithus orientalis]|uniref:uncharacterized protein n=1 Tax=Pisolithus orientalis TaxID=936130 RepID=UPI0022240DB2